MKVREETYFKWQRMNALGVTYHRLHHVLTEAPWSSSQVNDRRLKIMNKSVVRGESPEDLAS